MAVATEYPVQGVVRSVGNGTIAINPAGTNYELHLRLQGVSAVAAGATVRGIIQVKGRKVWTVSSGGNFVTPITGEPRVIQGRVMQADAARLVVQAGMSVIVELPQEPTAYDLVNGPVAVGTLVNITLLPGATFESIR